jgi:nucleoid-associated protein YgaU
MSQRSIDRAAEGEARSRDVSAVEWDDEPSTGVRVLWGRLFILLVLVALAVVAGRATAPGGAPDSELQALRTELEDARARIATLEAAAAEPDVTPTVTVSPPPEEPADEGNARGRQTYVVRSGDTLSTIAERFYENASLGDVIAEANDITDPSQLSVGRELVIPERPEL